MGIDERFLLLRVVVVEPDAPAAEREAARDWLARSWSFVHPWGTGRVYPNFPDPDLEDWARVPRNQLRAAGPHQGEVRTRWLLPLPPVDSGWQSNHVKIRNKTAPMPRSVAAIVIDPSV